LVPSFPSECPFQIGFTPLTRFFVQMNGMTHELAVKEERFNEFGSIKDRVAWYVWSHSMNSADPKRAIIDASSGNYGYALARIGERLGIPVTIVSSPSISHFNADGIRSAGARLVIAEAQEGESSNGARMRVAGEIAEAEDSLFLDQYRSPLNPAAHQNWTAPELLSGGGIDACFVAASSGGTARGFADYISNSGSDTELVLVEPFGSCAFVEADKGMAGGLCIPGYGSGRSSTFSDMTTKPEVLRVCEADVLAAYTAFRQSNFPALGLSSLGVVVGALEWLSHANTPKRVACVCADGDERYSDEFEERYLPKVDSDVYSKALERLTALLPLIQPVHEETLSAVAR